MSEMRPRQQPPATRRPRRQRGFSLIELLIVVAIIGIIASLSIPSYLRARAAAAESRAIAYVRTWHGGQELYKRKYGYYADADETLVQEQLIVGKDAASSADDDAYTYSVDSPALSRDQWYGRATPRAGLGTKYLYSDETGIIHYRYGGNASRTSPALGVE